jgi:ureidoglycolate hydrolase
MPGGQALRSAQHAVCLSLLPKNTAVRQHGRMLTLNPPNENALRELRIAPLSAAAFAPFGGVMPPLDDGFPFGPHDARLELSGGIPRFYTMRIPGRGLTVTHITRHRQVTQALAAVGGLSWVIAVAPPLEVERADAEPALEDIRAFRIPGDTAIMLARGTWHAGPLFEGKEACFFNLELADTNVVDHHTCNLVRRYGAALRLTEGKP